MEWRRRLSEIWRALAGRPVGRALEVHGSNAGITVTPERAMTLSAVFGCVRIISETIGSLPMHLYRRTELGAEVAHGHPLDELLHDAPNPLMDSAVFWEAMMGQVLLFGNAYAEIEFDGAGRVAALWPLSAPRVRMMQTAGGAVYYEVYPSDGQARRLPDWAVWHIMGYSPNGLLGADMVSMMREAVGVGLAVDEYGARFFANGSHTGGFVQTDKPLSDDAFERLNSDLREKYAGLSHSHRLILLEDGLKFVRADLSPSDSQMLETKKYQVAEVARFFRVPPHLLQDLDRATNNNIEHQSIEFVTHCIRPWVVKIERSAWRKLLLGEERRDYFVRLNLAGLLRGDMKSRYECYAIGRQWGWLSPNDVRELEDLNRLPGGQGDLYLTPGNMIPSDRMDEYVDHMVGTGSEAIGGEFGGGGDSGGAGGSEGGAGARGGSRSAGHWDFKRGGERRAAPDIQAAFGVRALLYEQLKAGVQAWLSAQAKELREIVGEEMEAGKRTAGLAGPGGAVRTSAQEEAGASKRDIGVTGAGSAVRARTQADRLLRLVNAYYRALAERGAQALEEAVAAGEFPGWRTMNEALEAMARETWAAVRQEIGEVPGLDEAWMRGFMERYRSDMSARLCKANEVDLVRVIRRADRSGGALLDGLSVRLGTWARERFEGMAANEVALCVNEAKIAAYRKAGYGAVWQAGADCCRICQRLSGKPVFTLKPPLHKGCTCTVSLGARFRPDGLQSPVENGILDTPEKARAWVKSEDCNRLIREGQQKKHIAGTREYEQYAKALKEKGQYGPSRLTISLEEAQELVERFAGSGEFLIGRRGVWDQKESVEFDREIGEVVNNLDGAVQRTRRGRIHYSKYGVHIVPHYSGRR